MWYEKLNWRRPQSWMGAVDERAFWLRNWVWFWLRVAGSLLWSIVWFVPKAYVQHMFGQVVPALYAKEKDRIDSRMAVRWLRRWARSFGGSGADRPSPRELS